MASEDDLGDIIASSGLSRILASAGIDSSQLSGFLGEGSGQSSKQLAEVEAEDDDEDKYEDDISDDGLPAESAADALAREREQAAKRREEERWIRKGMEMQAHVNDGTTKGKEKEVDKGLTMTKKEKEALQLKAIWPDFQKGKRLRMSEVFYETPADKIVKSEQRKKRKRPDGVKEHIVTIASPPPSLPAAFLLPSLPQLDIYAAQPRYTTPLGAYFDQEWIKDVKSSRRKEMTRPPRSIELDFSDIHSQTVDHGTTLELGDWEKGIVMCSLNAPPSKDFEPLASLNIHLDNGDWLNDVIWDARRIVPTLLESDEDDELPVKATKKAVVVPTTKAPVINTKAQQQLDPFNLSNDHLYEHSREARFRIRQTFGAIEVFHSQPAKILQMPFYKTSLSKAEARAWRRPALQFPTGVTFTFSKLKSNPSAAVSSKKKHVVADPSERFKTTKDLSLTEKGPYALFEFSEEYPPIMSGYGMGTTIVNYYRKTDDKDDTIPKEEFGQPSILNPADAEPFLLGYVDQGKVTQILHNNLIRAPLFRHTPETTDFLVIRQTINGHSTYHLRAIQNVFTVGQTVPNESEVHGPHARKNTNTSKMRLMIVAWLLMQKSKQKRLEMRKLVNYFPDQTELQVRQRLKIKGNEFLMYARSDGAGKDGHWTLNPEYDFPTDRKSVMELCSPEAAMLFEAMQVGARHLHDAGYKKTAEGAAEDDNDDSVLDIEQQLAVWSTTRNYKLAEAQKAWLLIHGEGDPTGRGEGFSFLRTNMKNYFLRKGETEQGRRLEAEARAGGNPVKISNAAQNQIYEEEKRKVWDLQAASLSDPTPPDLDEDDHSYQDRYASTPVGLGPRFQRGDSRRAFSRGNSMTATPAPMYAESPRDGSPSAFSMDGESTFTGNPTAGKVLRIKRTVKGKEQVEIVRDPQVIATYLRRLEEKKIEYYMNNTDIIAPTGNEEEDDIRRAALQKQIDKYKLNQQRRLARKKYMSKTLEVDDGDLEGKRKCSACGAIGHTRANRNCPMFNSYQNNSVSASPATGPSGYGGYTPVDTTTTVQEPAPTTSFKIRLGTGGAK